MKNKNRNKIGARIRQLREEKGFSQEAMALELDMSQSQYGRLEKDDSLLSIARLISICDILKTSIVAITEDELSSLKNFEQITTNASSNKTNKESVYDQLIEKYEIHIQNITSIITQKDEIIAHQNWIIQVLRNNVSNNTTLQISSS